MIQILSLTAMGVRLLKESEGELMFCSIYVLKRSPIVILGILVKYTRPDTLTVIKGKLGDIPKLIGMEKGLSEHDPSSTGIKTNN